MASQIVASPTAMESTCFGSWTHTWCLKQPELAVAASACQRAVAVGSIALKLLASTTTADQLGLRFGVQAGTIEHRRELALESIGAHARADREIDRRRGRPAIHPDARWRRDVECDWANEDELRLASEA